MRCEHCKGDLWTSAGGLGVCDCQTVESDRDRLIRENKQHAEDIEHWHLWPYDGICWNCKADLVEHYGEDYSTATPTGCPKCHMSYCD